MARYQSQARGLVMCGVSGDAGRWSRKNRL